MSRVLSFCGGGRRAASLHRPPPLDEYEECYAELIPPTKVSFLTLFSSSSGSPRFLLTAGNSFCGTYPPQEEGGCCYIPVLFGFMANHGIMGGGES